MAAVHYDPATGVFTHKESGKRAGTLTHYGYCQLNLRRKLYYAHRLAFLYMEGVMPPEHVDHINGVKDDNRWSNLRHATRVDNARNAKLARDNRLGIPGVRVVYKGRYQAYISGPEGHVTLGTRECFFEACCLRKRAELEHNYHPNHGRINP